MRPTRMTEAMRRSLETRLSGLESRIADLTTQREDDDSSDLAALLLQLSRERDQILDALAGAVLIDDAPFDSDAIEVGDRVTLREPGGGAVSYVLVEGPFSSRVNSDWVSVSSPLGAALLGRGVGDEVVVNTPAGASIYVVVAFERASQLDVPVGAGPGSSPRAPAA